MKNLMIVGVAALFLLGTVEKIDAMQGVAEQVRNVAAQNLIGPFILGARVALGIPLLNLVDFYAFSVEANRHRLPSSEKVAFTLGYLVTQALIIGVIYKICVMATPRQRQNPVPQQLMHEKG